MIKRLFGWKRGRRSLLQPLQPGVLAPDFSLPSSTGGSIRLLELRGNPTVLVFYPADDSPVCSNQLALYNEALSLFQEYDAQLIGISTDSVASHRTFASSLNLRFPLLADDNPQGAVSRMYGVYDAKDGVSERALYVLDADGVIQWSHLSPRDVNPGANGILDALESQ
jgi:peroxiredoxin